MKKKNKQIFMEVNEIKTIMGVDEFYDKLYVVMKVYDTDKYKTKDIVLMLNYEERETLLNHLMEKRIKNRIKMSNSI